MSDPLKRRQTVYNIVSIVVLVGICAVATFAVGPRILDIVKDPDGFKAFIGDNRAIGALLFLAIQIFQVLFALIPGEPIEIFAGVLFGAWWGLALCLAGVTAATVLIFALTRRFGKRFTYIVFAEDKLNSLRFMQNEKRVELILFLLLFIPGTPKDILTYMAGLTRIRFRRFLLIATVAKIPSILTSTLAGEKLIEQDYRASLIIFGVTALVSAAGLLLYRIITRRKNKNAAENESDPKAD